MYVLGGILAKRTKKSPNLFAYQSFDDSVIDVHNSSTAFPQFFDD